MMTTVTGSHHISYNMMLIYLLDIIKKMMIVKLNNDDNNDQAMILEVLGVSQIKNDRHAVLSSLDIL